MISAYEARRRTILNTKLKGVMKAIEEDINNKIEDGLFDTSIAFTSRLDPYLLDILTKELESLKYKVKYEPAKPLPAGCPSDQWDFNDYLNISWEKLL